MKRITTPQFIYKEVVKISIAFGAFGNAPYRIKY